MKLIAIKRISAKLPLGAEFDYPDRQARMLIAIGIARAANETASTSRRPARRRAQPAEA